MRKRQSSQRLGAVSRSMTTATRSEGRGRTGGGSATTMAQSRRVPRRSSSGVLGDGDARKLRGEVLGTLRDLHRHLAGDALVEAGDLAFGIADDARPATVGLDPDREIERQGA